MGNTTKHLLPFQTVLVKGAWLSNYKMSSNFSLPWHPIPYSKSCNLRRPHKPFLSTLWADSLLIHRSFWYFCVILSPFLKVSPGACPFKPNQIKSNRITGLLSLLQSEDWIVGYTLQAVIYILIRYIYWQDWYLTLTKFEKRSVLKWPWAS